MNLPSALARNTKPQLASSCFRITSEVALAGACKQNAAPSGGVKSLILQTISGAGEEIRTLDPNLGNREGIAFRHFIWVLVITGNCKKALGRSAAARPSCKRRPVGDGCNQS